MPTPCLLLSGVLEQKCIGIELGFERPCLQSLTPQTRIQQHFTFEIPKLLKCIYREGGGGTSFGNKEYLIVKTVYLITFGLLMKALFFLLFTMKRGFKITKF